MAKPTSQKPQDSKGNGLDFSDLNGTVSSAIVFPDSHFGLESGVWKNAQRIADMLPVDVTVFGDLDETEVATFIDKAKGAEIQAKNWGEYSTAVSRYLKAFQKVREKQSEVSENIAEARNVHAELEKSLGTNLANLESKYRQIVGGSRSAIAGVQDDLTISLNRIASQYTESKTKKQERLTTESKEKVPTAYEEQTTSLVDKFRQLRDARFSGASVGITQRVKAS